MRIVNWRYLPILFLFSVSPILARQQPTFRNLFRSADTVLIGRVVSGTRVLESDPRFGIPARPVDASKLKLRSNLAILWLWDRELPFCGTWNLQFVRSGFLVFTTIWRGVTRSYFLAVGEASSVR
jgi:hypothetical protein